LEKRFWRAIMNPVSLRASDGDRHRTVEVLRRATTEGYLSLDEFGERVDRAFQARFLHELDPLLADIPGTPRPSAGWLPPTPPPPVPAPAWRPSGPGSPSSAGPWWPPMRVPVPLGVLFRVSLAVLVVMAVVAAVADFWFPPVPLLVFGFFCWKRAQHRRGWPGWGPNRPPELV